MSGLSKKAFVHRKLTEPTYETKTTYEHLNQILNQLDESQSSASAKKKKKKSNTSSVQLPANQAIARERIPITEYSQNPLKNPTSIK